MRETGGNVDPEGDVAGEGDRRGNHNQEYHRASLYHRMNCRIIIEELQAVTIAPGRDTKLWREKKPGRETELQRERTGQGERIAEGTIWGGRPWKDRTDGRRGGTEPGRDHGGPNR